MVDGIFRDLPGRLRSSDLVQAGGLGAAEFFGPVTRVPRLWKYTANVDAEQWVKDRALLLAADFAVPFYEALYKLTVTGPATLDEIETLTAVVGPGPPAQYLKRMVQNCRNDKTWKDAATAEDRDVAWARGAAMLKIVDGEGP